MKNVKAAIEQCRKALESCPHDAGTVSVMCTLCLGDGTLFAWDVAYCKFLSVDCPRCDQAKDNDVPEVCPCLEHFSKEIIEHAIEGKEDSYPSLSQAVSWIRPPDKLGTTLNGAAAEEQLQKLRAWAEEHKEITIPHPKAALILDLIDHGMIAFATVPGTGLVLRAKSAKEEFSRFIADLNRSYKHDDSTILTMLCFAYGVVSWKFDPVELHR